MVNVHPVLLAKIQEQLPEGATIDSAISVGPGKSEFRVGHNGGYHAVEMPKSAIDHGNRVLQITASEGEIIENVVMRLSNKYGLCLVKGVDFWNKAKLAFQGRAVTTVSVSIREDAIFYKGDFSFDVVNEAEDKIKDIRVKENNYSEQQVNLALCSVVPVRKAPSFSGKTLSKDFVDQIVGYLTKVGCVPTKKKVESWQKGEVVDVLHDGVSHIILLTVDDHIHSIRCVLEDTDRPIKK